MVSPITPIPILRCMRRSGRMRRSDIQNTSTFQHISDFAVAVMIYRFKKGEFMGSLLEKIRNAQRETKDFPYKIGDEEFIITVQKFKPGTAMRLRKTALIKLYKVIKAEAVPLSEMTEEDFSEQMEAQDARFRETNERFCEAVIDKESGEKYVTLEDAEELFDNDFKETCVQYAMGGATPPDPDDLTEEEEFPAVSSEPEESGV